MGNEDEETYEDVSEKELQKQKEDSRLSDEEFDNLMNDPYAHIWGDDDLDTSSDGSAKISEEDLNDSVIPKMKELENRATHCNFDSSKLSVKEESKDSGYNPLEVVDLEVDTILPDGFKIEPVEEDSSGDE